MKSKTIKSMDGPKVCYGLQDDKVGAVSLVIAKLQVWTNSRSPLPHWRWVTEATTWLRGLRWLRGANGDTGAGEAGAGQRNPGQLVLGARPGDISLRSDFTYLTQITLHHYLLHNTQLRRYYTSFMLLYFCMVAVIF